MTMMRILFLALSFHHCHLSVSANTASSPPVATGYPPSPAFATKNGNTTSAAASAAAVGNNTSIADQATTHNNNTFNTISLTTAATSIPEWKRQLPFPLSNKTQTLQRIVIPSSSSKKVVEIYLLGTAHVSVDSSRDVRLLLESVQPDIIFLELCDQRIPMLVMPPAAAATSSSASSQHLNNETATTTTIRKEKIGLWQRLRQRRRNKSKEELEARTEQQQQPPKKSMYSVAASLLTNMQEDYAQSLGVELGGEFRVAYEYWDEACSQQQQQQQLVDDNNNHNSHRQQQRRVHMILGDRPLYLTLTRAWESLRLWGKAKLLLGLLLSSFQRPDPKELQEWMQSILLDDSGDLLSKSIAELAKHFPTLEEVIIRERDAYMACKMYQTSRHMLGGSGASITETNNNKYSNDHPRTYRIVAIVGAGHVNGICKWLTEPNDSQESPEEILTRLVQLKKNPMAEEDLHYLVHDIMEVNPDLLKDMLKDMQS